MQPTDPKSQVGFRVLWDMKAARRIERVCRICTQGLVATERQDRHMKAVVIRLAATIGAIALTALAGGASLKGF